MDTFNEKICADIFLTNLMNFKGNFKEFSPRLGAQFGFHQDTRSMPKGLLLKWEF